MKIYLFRNAEITSISKEDNGQAEINSISVWLFDFEA